MYGNVVAGIPGERFEQAIAAAKGERGVSLDTELDAGALRELTGEFKRLYEFPADPPRAAARRDPRGVRLLAGRARGRLPAHQPHPRRVGHGGERPADGVRQPRREQRQRRGLLARRAHRRARAIRRLPAQRAGRGRRLGRAHAARPRRAARVAAGGPRRAAGDPAHARAPLRRHAGHRVHRPGRPPVHAADAQRQAPRAGGGALRRRRRRRGPARPRAAR